MGPATTVVNSKLDHKPHRRVRPLKRRKVLSAPQAVFHLEGGFFFTVVETRACQEVLVLP